jgi:hypothetical protein
VIVPCDILWQDLILSGLLPTAEPRILLIPLCPSQICENGKLIKVSIPVLDDLRGFLMVRALLF